MSSDRMADSNVEIKPQLNSQESILYSVQMQIRLLGSLKFEDMYKRMNDIDRVEEGTYQWILDTQQGDLPCPWPGPTFVDWLSSGTEIFWIQGKAGSGKSTLMRFLWQNDRIPELVQQPLLHRQSLVLRYSFWLSGTTLQRSLKGFMVSLMHQLLLHSLEYRQPLLATYPELTHKRSIEDWSINDLINMLRITLQGLTHTTNVCLFVDGLDEIEPRSDYPRLLDFMKTVTESHKIKICVSSRPESYWLDHLTGLSFIRLEDMTSTDMRRFITSKLVQSGYPVRHDDDGAERLVNCMVRKADGVFLWVQLVMDLVLEALADHAEWSEAEAIVDQLPSPILELYEAKLARIGVNDPASRVEAAIYLQACLAHGSGQAELSELISLKARIDKQSVVDGSFNKIDLLRSYETLLERIPQVCAGMLECEKRDFNLISKHLQKGGESIIEGSSIDRTKQGVLFPVARLSHRTVRDFLLDTKAGKSLLAASPLSNEDIFLCSVEANLMRSLLGVKFFRLAGAITKISPSWSHVAANVSEHTLNQALCLIEKSILKVALAQNRLREETKQMATTNEKRSWSGVQFDLLASDTSSYWPKANALDINGLLLENRIFPFTCRPLLNLSGDNTAGQPHLSQRYKDYLLLCCLNYHSITFSTNANSPIVSTLIERGADPYATFFLPPSEPRFSCVAAELVHRFYLDSRRDCDCEFWISILKQFEIKSQRCIIRVLTGTLQYIQASTSLREANSLTDIWVELDVAPYLQGMLENFESYATSGTWKPFHLRQDNLDTKVMLSKASWPFDEDKEPIYVPMLNEKESAAILSMMDMKIEQDRVEMELHALGNLDLDKMEARWEHFHEYIEEVYESSSAPRVELTAFLKSKGYIPDPSDPRMPMGAVPRFEIAQSAHHE